MTTQLYEDIRTLLQHEAEEFNRVLGECEFLSAGVAPKLRQAVEYSLQGGGKRLRPILVVWCCEACGGARAAAWPPALSIECVHTFGLIHDDLPALDDDDIRRGRPTTHRRFGEALAILAGDALLASAFEMLARSVSDPLRSAAMVAELSEATGASGMIGGEALDLEGESREADAADVAEIHSAKTARLFQAACRLGGIAAGADEDRLDSLSAYGHALGMAFQIVDDLLDVTGTLEQTGKQTGKDAAAGKQTYPRAIGEEASRRLAAETVDQAIRALKPIGLDTSRLVSLARHVLERSC